MVVESEVLEAQNCPLSKFSLPMHSNGCLVGIRLKSVVFDTLGCVLIVYLRFNLAVIRGELFLINDC